MKAVKVTHEDALVEYGQGQIGIRITGCHGSAEQATQLIEQITNARHINARINPIDSNVARKMIEDWDRHRERVEKTSYTGTRISVDRM